MVNDPDFVVAMVGFGEAGQALVQGWAFADPARVKAFDIKTDGAATRDAKRADYARFGVTGCDGAADALANADVVFSLVTADQAEIAATGAAPAMKAGALFMDGNSCAPETKKRSARAIEAAGGRYVDVAVMAPVHPALHKVSMVLSGPHVAAALEVVAALEMTAREAVGPVGTASSIKMIRSVVMKGLEAIACECVLAGQKAGVADVVLESLDKTYPGFDWKAKAGYMLERVMTHGIRRAAEMREVARTVDDLGLGGTMARATVDWQQRIGDLHLDAGDGDYAARADMILAALEGETKP